MKKSKSKHQNGRGRQQRMVSHRIRISEWSHPNWDMSLLLRSDGKDGKPQDYLSKSDDAREIACVSNKLMTEDAYHKHPAFDG